MDGKELSFDARYDGGADEIISDSDSIDHPHHPPGPPGPPQSRSAAQQMHESIHSDIDIDISSCDGISPDVSPIQNSRKQHHQHSKSLDGLDFQTSTQRRSSRDLMGSSENVGKESLHMTDLLQLSDSELSEQDSFADANSNEIVTDDDFSISDDEVDEDDDDYDDDFDEDGYYKYAENEGFQYHETAYHSESDDEITVEDALATIMEGEEEEESDEEEEESDEEENDRTHRGGSIHQSLYRFALMEEEEEKALEESNHSVEVMEMALGGESKSPPKRFRPPGEFLDEGEEDLNDSGYFMNKAPLYEKSSAMESAGIIEEEDDIASLLRSENWNALKPFLNKLRMSDDDYIRDELTTMDLFGHTKMYPIHFIVWRAPNSFIKNFISSLPHRDTSETLSRLDSFGNSPLHLACSGLDVNVEKDSIDISVVEIISECGPETHEMLNKQGESPLALLMNSKALKADPAKLKASEATAERLVRSMLAGRKHLIKRKNMFDFKTLLHTGASFGVHEKVLIALLELSDPSIAGMVDTSKRIPLHYIAGCVSGKRPQASLAEKLVEANKEGVIRTNTSGDTPLHVFVSDITQRIKEEEDLNSPNTAKMAEVLLGSKEDENLCSLLVKNSAELSPLHCCALYNAPKNIMEEFSKSPFFAKAATITGPNSATPLHLACASSKIRATLEKLKFFGTAEAAVMRDQKSRTPMHVAAENPKMTKHFIKALVEINPKAAKVRNSKGRMPLHVALRKNAKDTIIKALLKANPQAVKSTFSGRNSVFHEMCEYNTSVAIMQSMLKLHPAGSNVKNKSGNLPLHVAIAFECSIDVVKELLDAYPAGVTSRNKNGETPLHLAATKKSLEIVELLLNSGPKATIIANKDGQKPLDAAKLVEGNDEVASFIEAKTQAYREERAQQKAKTKERRTSSKTGTKKKRGNNRSRSNSDDFDEPEEEESKKPSSMSRIMMKKKRASRPRSNSADLDGIELEEEAPKKPSSLSDMMSRASGSKQRRRASGGDGKSVDPDAKQDKRPIRRMLKSFQGSKPKKETSGSDESGEQKDKKTTVQSMKEKAKRGLTRSKSDKGLRQAGEVKVASESSPSQNSPSERKLKPSRSFKLSKKLALGDDVGTSSPRTRSKRNIFSKKNRRASTGQDYSEEDVVPSKEVESTSIDEPKPPSVSPIPSRKIRSGRKRESKTPPPGADPNAASLVDSNGARLESGGSAKRKSRKSPKRKSKHDRDQASKEESKPSSESSLSKTLSESSVSKPDSFKKPLSGSSLGKPTSSSSLKPTSESSVSKHGTSSSSGSKSTADSSSVSDAASPSSVSKGAAPAVAESSKAPIDPPSSDEP
ncbi:unnamed protein product [Cylindrotheca closterium]|uniref:Uncharacterized protein n=1 Tax=Cylindrotheca closterium TaxID=2856 RepID=A0AAD2FPF2_9STRA|nr:unnamed protein product [Cylindrotheca closterium]